MRNSRNGPIAVILRSALIALRRSEMALPDANPWFRSLTTLMRAGQEAWLEYGRLYRPVRDRPRPSPEPAWTTPHAVRLDLPTMRLRGFSTGDASGRATILVAPFALHQATIADFAPGHSIVETLVAAGVSLLFVVQCKSATATMPFVSIDDYLAGLNVCVDEVGGRVNLVGLCQGGWLSLAYAARFPDKIGR